MTGVRLPYSLYSVYFRGRHLRGPRQRLRPEAPLWCTDRRCAPLHIPIAPKSLFQSMYKACALSAVPAVTARQYRRTCWLYPLHMAHSTRYSCLVVPVVPASYTCCTCRAAPTAYRRHYPPYLPGCCTRRTCSDVPVAPDRLYPPLPFPVYLPSYTRRTWPAVFAVPPVPAPIYPLYLPDCTRRTCRLYQLFLPGFTCCSCPAVPVVLTCLYPSHMAHCTCPAVTAVPARLYRLYLFGSTRCTFAAEPATSTLLYPTYLPVCTRRTCSAVPVAHTRCTRWTDPVVPAVPAVCTRCYCPTVLAHLSVVPAVPAVPARMYPLHLSVVLAATACLYPSQSPFYPPSAET